MSLRSLKATGTLNAAGSGVYASGSAFADLPVNWDRVWRAAKAGQAATPAWLAVIGHSFAFGQCGSTSSTDWYNDGWVTKLRTGLVAADNPLYAEYVPTYMCPNIDSRLAASPFGTISSLTAFYDIGLGRAANFGGTVTITCPAGTTAVDLIYTDYTVGSWSYTVDGGGAQTVNCTGFAQASVQLKKVSIAGLSAGGSHTIVVTGAASTIMMLNGAAFYTGNNGIGVARCAFSAMAASTWVAARGASSSQQHTSCAPDNKDALWCGTASANSTAQFNTFPLRPSLAIISLDLNDCNYGIHPTVYAYALRRLVDACRRGVEDCSVLFVCNSQSNGVVNDDGSYGVPAKWPQYKSIMRQVARDTCSALIDVDSAWGQDATSRGFRSASTDQHPTPAGHTDIAARVLAVI